MITYRTLEKDPHVTVTVLHKVYYNDNFTFSEIYSWCKEYCKESFYTSPGWSGKFVEFEDDEDAVLFALKWA